MAPPEITDQRPPRTWSVVDFILIWLGGLLGTGVFLAAGVAIGNDDLLILLGLGGQYVGNLGVFWILSRIKDNSDVGFAIQGGDFWYVALGLAFQVVMAIAFLPLSNLLFPEGRPPQEVADVIAGADSTLMMVGLILAAVVLAPVTEEIMFRGVLLRALEPRGRVFALVISSLVFSLIHVLGLDTEMLWRSAVVVLPPIFILGLVLGWLTQRTGRLGPAIFLHSGWNLLAAFVLILPPEIMDQVG